LPYHLFDFFDFSVFFSKLAQRRIAPFPSPENSMVNSNFGVLEKPEKGRKVSTENSSRDLGSTAALQKHDDERFKMSCRMAANASFCVSEREVTHGTT